MRLQEDTVVINFALLGCGRIGLMHARNLAKADGVRLATVFDTNTSAAEATATAVGCTVSPRAIPRRRPIPTWKCRVASIAT